MSARLPSAGDTPETSPVPGNAGHPLVPNRLYPSDVNVPEQSVPLVVAVLSPMIEFRIASVPASRRTPPPCAAIFAVIVVLLTSVDPLEKTPTPPP